MQIWKRVILHNSARKVILQWPMEVKKDLGSILTKLQKGEKVGYPDTKPMEIVANGCFELRITGLDGIYRAFYICSRKQNILVFHAFKKKTQKTPSQEINTGRKRLKVLEKELENEENT